MATRRSRGGRSEIDEGCCSFAPAAGAIVEACAETAFDFRGAAIELVDSDSSSPASSSTIAGQRFSASSILAGRAEQAESNKGSAAAS